MRLISGVKSAIATTFGREPETTERGTRDCQEQSDRDLRDRGYGRGDRGDEV